MALIAKASDSQLLAMRTWAAERASEADRRGMGRNPRARRLYRKLHDAAGAEVEQRGLNRF